MARKNIAYIAPFLIFILFLGLSQALDKAGIQPGGLPDMYLVFPLQTLACAALLARFWPAYALSAPRKPWLPAAIGILAFAIWVSPQLLLHQSPRLTGFDPNVLASRPTLYWSEMAARFLRLVIVVPLLEEIFWRGFLLRYFIDEQFETVPFGTYAHIANALVAAGFMFEHSRPDWPAALATGLLYNSVAFRTRSLSSCVLAHALTNALLGAFIMITHQWGFW
jgi:CAAX prenyl protease-like protein